MEERAPAGQRTILLVDDEPHVRYIMALNLRKAGYHVETASDGEEGARAAAEIKPDLILSDFQMPRANGLQMCRALATNPITRAIPVVMLTSRDFDITPEQTAGTGIRAVRNKPFSPRDILTVIAGVLQARAA